MNGRHRSGHRWSTKRSLIAGAGLLMLGAVALPQLRIGGLPRWTAPRLSVMLDTSIGRYPPELVERWVIEIETLVHSVGEVRRVVTWAQDSGAFITAELREDADPELVRIRLTTLLNRVRARLPAETRLSVLSGAGAGGRLTATLWLRRAGSSRSIEALIADLRRTPGVNLVQEIGLPEDQIRVELDHRPSGPGGVRAEVIEALRMHGRSYLLPLRDDPGGRPLLIGGTAKLESLPIEPAEGVPASPLSTLATIRRETGEADVEVHHRGAPAVAVLVYRAPDASPVALAKRIGRLADRHELEARGWFEGLPMLRLLALTAVVLLAAVAAATAVALARFGRSALWLPFLAAVGGGGAAVGLSMLPGEIDVAVLAAVLAALLAGLALGWQRLVHAPERPRAGLLFVLLAAATVPAAIHLAGDPLTVRWLPAANAAWVVLAGFSVATALVPVGVLRGRRAGAERRLALLGLRDPAGVLLGLGLVLLVLIGLVRGVEAVSSPIVHLPGDLVVEVTTPDRSRSSAGERLARLERLVAEQPEVVESWSLLWPGSVQVFVSLAPEAARPDRRAAFTSRLRDLTRGLGSVQIEKVETVSPGFAGTSALEAAWTDAEATRYHLVLRGASYAELTAARARIARRLGGLALSAVYLEPPPPPGQGVRLVPRRPLPTAALERMAADLRESTAGERLLTEGGVRIAVSEPGRSREAPLDLETALGLELEPGPGGAPRTVHDLFAVRSATYPRELLRVDGRFVDPLEIRLAHGIRSRRLEQREVLDRSLRALPLPASCRLELPDLAHPGRPEERPAARAELLLTLALVVAVAAVRLGRGAAALAAPVPATIGVLAAGPQLAVLIGGYDQVASVAVLVAAGCLSAVAIEVLAHTGADPGVPGAGGRAAIRRLLGRSSGAPVAVVLGLTAAGLALLPWGDQGAWIAPLRAAATTFAVGAATVPLLAAALGGAELARSRARATARSQRRQPLAWRSLDAPPTLGLRRLGMVYSGGHRALHNVSADLEPGVTALLGPNGAGKTTLIRIITGLLRPSTGHVRFRGLRIDPENRAAFLDRVGYLPQGHRGYRDLTGRRYLDYWAAERGLGEARRATEVARCLAAVGLGGRADVTLASYSGGMLRRLGLAQALLGEPEVLIVDEPDVGLDLESRREVLEALRALASGRIVLVSTHRTGDVPQLADRVLLLDRGTCLFYGAPAALVEQAPGGVRRALVPPEGVAALEDRYILTSREVTAAGVEVRLLAPAGSSPPGEPVAPTFEEVYLLYTSSPEVSR